MVPMAASLVASMTSSLIKPVASSLINALAKKESWELEKNKELDFSHYFHCL